MFGLGFFLGMNKVLESDFDCGLRKLEVRVRRWDYLYSIMSKDISMFLISSRGVGSSINNY